MERGLQFAALPRIILLLVGKLRPTCHKLRGARRYLLACLAELGFQSNALLRKQPLLLIKLRFDGSKFSQRQGQLLLNVLQRGCEFAMATRGLYLSLGELRLGDGQFC